MPPKKKKSVERGTKNISKGDDNQQQIVNVTVNIPREKTKKAKKDKPKIDPQAVRQLENSVQQYEALLAEAKEKGIDIPPELELNVNSGSVKTTQDVLALNAKIKAMAKELILMIKPQGASDFNQLPSSALLGIGSVPQMRARPGFNEQSGYDNPKKINNATNADKNDRPALPSSVKTKETAFVGLGRRHKPTASSVSGSASFETFLKSVTFDYTGSWVDLFTGGNVEANKANGASQKDLQLAWIYGTAMRFLTDKYPKIGYRGQSEELIHDPGFEVFYDNATTFIGPTAPPKSTWNHAPQKGRANEHKVDRALYRIKFLFLTDVGNLENDMRYNNNTTSTGSLEDQINDLENQLNGYGSRQTPALPPPATSPTTPPRRNSPTTPPTTSDHSIQFAKQKLREATSFKSQFDAGNSPIPGYNGFVAFWQSVHEWTGNSSKYDYVLTSRQDREHLKTEFYRLYNVYTNIAATTPTPPQNRPGGHSGGFDHHLGPGFNRRHNRFF